MRKTKRSPILPYGPSFPTVGRKKVWESLLYSGKEKNGGDQERKGTAHLQIRSLPLFFFLPPKKKKKGKIATRKKLRKSAPSFDASFLWEATSALFSLLCFIKRTVSRVIIVGVFLYISPFRNNSILLIQIAIRYFEQIMSLGTSHFCQFVMRNAVGTRILLLKLFKV